MQTEKRNRKGRPNYILWSWCFFLTVLTQLICFSVNYPLPHTQTTPSTSTSPGYLGLIGNMRSYLHFKALMQHFPQSYYRQSDFLTCVLTSEIRQECLDSNNPKFKCQNHTGVRTLTPTGLLHGGVYN